MFSLDGRNHEVPPGDLSEIEKFCVGGVRTDHFPYRRHDDEGVEDARESHTFAVVPHLGVAKRDENCAV